LRQRIWKKKAQICISTQILHKTSLCHARKYLIEDSKSECSVRRHNTDEKYSKKRYPKRQSGGTGFLREGMGREKTKRLFLQTTTSSVTS